MSTAVVAVLSAVDVITHNPPYLSDIDTDTHSIVVVAQILFKTYHNPSVPQKIVGIVHRRKQESKNDRRLTP